MLAKPGLFLFCLFARSGPESRMGMMGKTPATATAGGVECEVDRVQSTLCIFSHQPFPPGTILRCVAEMVVI